MSASSSPVRTPEQQGNFRVSYYVEEEEANPWVVPARMFLLLTTAVITGLSFYRELERGRARCWGFPLSTWVLVLEDAYLLVAVFEAVALSQRKRVTKLSGVAATSQGVVLPLAVLDAAVFWAYGRRYETATLISPLTHGGTVLVMLVDAGVSPRPIQLASALYFAAALGAHVSWSIVHFYLELGDCRGRRPLYPSVRWNRPASTAVAAVTLCVLGAVAAYLAALWVRLQAIPWCARAILFRKYSEDLTGVVSESQLPHHLGCTESTASPRWHQPHHHAFEEQPHSSRQPRPLRGPRSDGPERKDGGDGDVVSEHPFLSSVMSPKSSNSTHIQIPVYRSLPRT